MVEPPGTSADAPPASVAARGWTASLWVLVVVNLLPVVGVIQFGWKVIDVVFLYWFENLVVGVVTVACILLATGRDRATRGYGPVALWFAKIALVPFFILSYGGFCYGHGELIASMLGKKHPDAMQMTHMMLREPAMLVAVSALAASRFYSVVRNYIARREYRLVSAGEVMAWSYVRIVVLQMFILSNSIAMTAMDNPQIAIMIFVLLKLVVDVSMHSQARSRSA